MKQLDIIFEGVTFHFEELNEGGYFTQVPDLPAALSEGETLDEAFSNIQEAFQLALKCSLELNLPVPEHLRARVAKTA